MPNLYIYKFKIMAEYTKWRRGIHPHEDVIPEEPGTPINKGTRVVLNMPHLDGKRDFHGEIISINDGTYTILFDHPFPTIEYTIGGYVIMLTPEYYCHLKTKNPKTFNEAYRYLIEYEKNMNVDHLV